MGMQCDSGFCSVHRGEVRKVLVEGKDGTKHVFNYCEQAVMEDDWRGFRTWDWETGQRLGDEIEMRVSQVLFEIEAALIEYDRLRECGSDSKAALKSVLDVSQARLEERLFNDDADATRVGGQVSKEDTP